MVSWVPLARKLPNFEGITCLSFPIIFKRRMALIKGPPQNAEFSKLLKCIPIKPYRPCEWKHPLELK